MRNSYLLLSLFFLQACSYGTFYAPRETKIYPPTSPKSIAISTQTSLRLPYKTLGTVAVMERGGGESARRALQVEASRLGANAIIKLKMQRAFGKTAASGLAVLVHRKSFDNKPDTDF